MNNDGKTRVSFDELMDKIPQILEAIRISINEASEWILKTLEWCLVLGAVGYAATLFPPTGSHGRALDILYRVGGAYFALWLMLNAQAHLLRAFGHRYDKRLSSGWVLAAQLAAVLAAALGGYLIVTTVSSAVQALATIPSQ